MLENECFVIMVLVSFVNLGLGFDFIGVVLFCYLRLIVECYEEWIFIFEMKEV